MIFVYLNEGFLLEMATSSQVFFTCSSALEDIETIQEKNQGKFRRKLDGRIYFFISEIHLWFVVFYSSPPLPHQ